MEIFFTTNDPLDRIIAEHLPGQKILSSKQIVTGWTNIVIEVKTDQDSYFFRFPRNPFWSEAIRKDATVCQYIEGKTSFYTPQMKLCFDKNNRPFSMYKKIKGYTLGDRIYNLSHSALTNAAYDIAKFIKELSSIDLKNAPKEILYPISSFLKDIDYKHYDKHIDSDHDYIKKTERAQLVHGDLNIGNIIIDENNKVVGIIDFGFAGTGNPNIDVSRVLSRPVPKDFEQAFLAQFEDTSEIERLKTAWKHIDAGYVEHIRKCYPEITLPNL